MKDYAGLNIWLIGASSGIGRALAVELARRGAKLAISARRKEDLEALNQEMGGSHTVVPLDVTDADAVGEAAKLVAWKFPAIDAILFFAGTYQPMKLQNLDLDKANTIVQTNFIGALNLIHAALPLLLAQKKGQLALCASVAGYKGLANSQPYGASKAALINLAESLKAETILSGIDVRLINPGFVKTPMTDKNSFPMPMMIGAEQAAKIIADELKGDNFEIHFPRRFTWLMKILRLVPNRLYFRITPK